jgi:hypothetical protein
MAKLIIRPPHNVLNPRSDIPVSEVRAILSYDKLTGVMRWKVKRPKIKKGQIAVVKSSGHLSVQYLGVKYMASRLAWVIVNGKWPTHYIDHIDGNKLNNEWRNLREATPSQNAINSNHARKSPYRGVSPHYRRWRARITISRENRIHLGCFSTAEEAHEAYKQAAIKYHGEFARLT